VPMDEGTFDHWHVEARRRPPLEQDCGGWIARFLPAYNGMINLETIGGRIIEVHLRFADQWPDLYGPGWAEAVVGLYESGTWAFADRDRRDGYSVVLFGPHGRRYRHPPPDVVARAREAGGASSIQVTFHEDKDADRHAMPPGGFRLAILNGSDLSRLREGRATLAGWFGV
jgi:hypothetical protein